ncbi:MAG: hypothetical protein AB1805_09480 [Nitrospirota bacterium]
MRGRKRSWIVCLLKPVMLLALLVMIFSVVWLRSSVVSMEYTLSHLEKKRAELTKDRKGLLAARANLLSVGRLEHAAADGTGFAFPDRVKVVYVQEQKDRKAYKTSLAAHEAGARRTH